MNTPNPLLPQGTLPPRGRSNLYFKILMIFAVHIVVLGGILMVGCKNTTTADKAKTDNVAGDPASTVTTPGADLSTPAPMASTAGTTPGAATLPPAGASVTPPAVATTPLTAMTPPVVAPVVPAATGGSVYVVASGDLLSTIAKKNNVSLKALEDANPGVDPKKLQIKQKLQIPASAAVASADVPKAGADASVAASGDATTYIVKPGDVLTKIAKAHNTSVKAHRGAQRHEDILHQGRSKIKGAGDEDGLGGCGSRSGPNHGGPGSRVRRHRADAHGQGELVHRPIGLSETSGGLSRTSASFFAFS